MGEISSSPPRHLLHRMQIYVISVGKVKEPYFQEGIEEYAKRLRTYTSLRMIEVPDEKVPQGAHETQKAKVREKEGQSLLRAVPAGSFIIALHPTGEEWSSEEFAEQIRIREIDGPHIVAFLIGGELGLPGNILSASDRALSLSRLTFPHQMARLILLETLYRAFRQLRGEPYHR